MAAGSTGSGTCGGRCTQPGNVCTGGCKCHYGACVPATGGTTSSGGGGGGGGGGSGVGLGALEGLLSPQLNPYPTPTAPPSGPPVIPLLLIGGVGVGVWWYLDHRHKG